MSAHRALAKVAVNFFDLCSVVYIVVAKVISSVGQLFAQEADVLTPIRYVARVPFVGNQIPVYVTKLHVILNSVLTELFNGRILLEHVARQLRESKLTASTQSHVTANNDKVSVVKRIDKQRAGFQQFGSVSNAFFQCVVTLVLDPARILWQSFKLSFVQLQKADVERLIGNVFTHTFYAFLK